MQNSLHTWLSSNHVTNHYRTTNKLFMLSQFGWDMKINDYGNNRWNELNLAFNA